jgi:hypothetical protein
MLLRNVIFTIGVLLVIVICICFPNAIGVIFYWDSMFNNLGMSGLGFLLRSQFLVLGLAISTSLEIVLVGVLVYKNWISQSIGTITFLLLLTIIVIALISWRKLRNFGRSWP